MAEKPKLPETDARFLDSLLEKIGRGAIRIEEFKDSYLGKLNQCRDYNTQPYWKKFRDWGHGLYGGL